MFYGRIGVSFVYDFALRKYDHRGQWSATPKNTGWSKKTLGQTALKSRGSSLGVGGCLQRAPTPGLSPGGVS